MWDLTDAPEVVPGAAIDDVSQPVIDTEYSSSAASPAQAPAADLEIWGYDAEVEARHVDIGVNVTMYGAKGPKDTLIFLNQIKSGTPFVAHGGSNADLVFDQNGYVIDKPEDTKVMAEILRRSDALMGIAPLTGDFRLYGQGTGRISVGDGYENNLVQRVNTEDLPTEVIDGETYWYADMHYSGAHDSRDRTKSAKLYIIDLDETDHIRDLALIHHSHLDEHRAGEIYAPEFLADMEPYTTLRFMDWMLVNNLNLADDDSALDPEQRYIGVDHFTYNNAAGGSSLRFPSSVPIEHIVELANLVSADAWIPLPADITDARALELAQYVADTLDPHLQVYWEYGNEVWNGAVGFDSFFYAQHMASVTFEGFTGAGTHAAVEWTAYRGPQLYDLIDEVFDQDGPAARYVSSGWAHSPPIKSDGGLNWNSYNVSYFEAEWAQKMDDAPSKPGDIVTDYAIGMYHSSVQTEGEDALGAYLIEAYQSTELQAEALARWMLFGNTTSSFHDLDRDALTDPAVVSYHEGINIAVTKLLYRDLLAGLDTLRDLDTVLRLDGEELQYRGIHAAEWTTILRFEDVPPKSLLEMIEDVELIGHGFRRHGETTVGSRGGLLSNGDYRLDRHVAYVEHLGLDFVAYEGGTHLYQPRGDAMTAMFEAYDKSWAAVVQNAWLERLDMSGVDLFMNYMSHDRTVSGRDYWGALDYVGQPIADSPKAQVLYDTIAAGKPSTPPADDPVAASGAPVFDPGLVWNDPWNWTIGEDGTLTETEARNSPLRGRMPAPAVDLDQQVLTFDVATSNDSPGKLRVVVHARGGTNVKLADWEGDIADGETIRIALDEIPSRENELDIEIRRIWNKTGVLEISNFDIIGPERNDGPHVPEGGVLLSAGSDRDEWSQSGNWVLGADGTLTETEQKNATVHRVIELGDMPHEELELRLKVAANNDAPGRLRIVLQSFGGGSTHVLDFDEKVYDGDELALALDDIPEQHDRMRVIIRRVGSKNGDIELSDLVLAPIEIPVEAPAETEPQSSAHTETPPVGVVSQSGSEATAEPDLPVNDGTNPVPESSADPDDAQALADLFGLDQIELLPVSSMPESGGRSLLPGVGSALEQTDWNAASGWSFDDQGRVTESSATNAVLSTELRLTEGEAGTARKLVFDVSATDERPGELRVWFQAFGGGLKTLPGIEQSVHDGDHLSIDLGVLPAEHDRLRIIIRRVGAQQGELTLSNLALVPELAPDAIAPVLA